MSATTGTRTGRRHRLRTIVAIGAALALPMAAAPPSGAAAGGHGAAPRATPDSVTSPTVTLSTTAAGASAVTYDLSFATSGSGAIAAGGTITLAAPAGTTWPGSQQQCSYLLTDTTNAGGSFSCATAVDPGLSDLAVHGFLNHAGSLVTLVVPNAIAAGDHLDLVVSGVANPGAGSGAISVWTSGDTTPDATSVYAITAPGSVTNLTAAASSSAAGATAVTETLGFHTSATGAIRAGGSITLSAAPGTLWPGSQVACPYVLTDATHSSGSFSCPSGVQTAAPGLPVFTFQNFGGATATITVPNDIAAGDALTLVVTGLINPGTGASPITVQTSADPLPASANPSIAAAKSVTGLTFGASSLVAGATGVTYTIGFGASTSGALAAGGSMTLTAPAGTTWPASGADYAIADATTPSGSTSSVSGLQVAAGGSIATFGVPQAIGAGDALTLTVTGVTNAGAGSHTISVATSSDVLAAASPAYVLTGSPAATTSVSGASLARSTPTAGANGVTYTVGFTASGSGGLTGGAGLITLAAPSGTIFGACPYGCGGGNASYTITDATHPAGTGPAAPVAIGAGGSIVQIQPSATIQAGDAVSLAITQVTNPAAGSGAISLSTSADVGPVSVAETTAAPSSVSGVSVTRSTTAGRADGVTYTVGLTTSADGGLVGGASGGAITLAAPAGTIFGPCPYGCGGGNADYSIADATHPADSGAASPVGSAGNGSIVSIQPSIDIPAGDHISITTDLASNPAAGSGSIAVSTSSDPVPVSAALTTSAPAAVGGPLLVLSTEATGANNVTYTVEFTASGAGQLIGGQSAVSIVAPPGTVFDPLAAATVTDFTNPAGSGSVGTSVVVGGQTVVTLIMPNTISAGDTVAVSVGSVINPSTPGATSLAFSTSSDPVPVVLDHTLAMGTTMSGTIDAHAGGPAVGARVQACPTGGGGCSTATTDGSGAYSMPVVAGTYAVTANAPGGSHEQAATATFTAGSSPLTGVDLQLGPAPTIDTGITILTAGGTDLTSSTADPVLNWKTPFQVRIDPSHFPSGRQVIATEVVFHGTDSLTGRPAGKVVDLGGTVDGNPVGIPVGSDPIVADVPSLAPLHGPVTFDIRYRSYADDTTPPTGLAAPEIMDLVYPNAPPQQAPTDPIPGYVVNTGYPTPYSVGDATIVGPDAAKFAVVPLSAVNAPPAVPDCGTAQTFLQQYTGVGQPAPPNQCGFGVSFTPPPIQDAHVILYYATLRVKAGPSGQTLPVSLVGCDSRVSAAAAAVTGYDICAAGAQDGSDGGGGEDGGTGNEAGTNGDPGDGGSSAGSDGGGGTYIDPSGTVLVTDGTSTPVPLAGATVTLQQAGSLTGSYSAVPNGSAVMSPANRVNPDTTDADGRFGWDVLAGAYRVSATSAGCSTATSPGVLIPPPVTDLSLTVTCPSPPTRSATQLALAASDANPQYSKPVTLTATATGATSGSVTFAEGGTTLGTSVLSGGTAGLTLATLAPGVHHLVANYAGDGTHQPSSGNATVTVGAPHSADESFVFATYNDFVQRDPTSGELSSALSALSHGTSRATFVAALANSDVYVDALVQKLYHDTLGRPGDAGGVAYWAGQLQSKKQSVAKVAAQFYASPEYFSGIGGGTNTSWVTDLYDKILHRTPDAGGVSYWAGRAASKGRGSVALAFYQSSESAQTRVKSVYQALLGRAPDASGLAYWAGKVVASGDLALAVNLASSSEYFTRASGRFP